MQDAVLSSYQILNNWLKDGNLKSDYPKELENDRSISQIIFLNYFRSSQKYFPFINKIFNNYDVFSIPVKELFYLLKEMLYFTGYRQPFIQKSKKAEDNKLVGILKDKYPFLKKEEIYMLVDIIDRMEDKDVIYEMYGLYQIKSKRFTQKEKKEQQEKINSIINKDDLLDSL